MTLDILESEPECCGICLTPGDIGLTNDSSEAACAPVLTLASFSCEVAIAHPSCPRHGGAS